MTLTREPTERDILDAHAEAFFAKYHAPILGRIQTYNAATQLADVEPLVILRVEGLDLTAAPILRGVPVAFPGGGGTAITWPLNPGDPVELIPQDADFGAYWASGTVGQLPQSKRRFNLSDCVCLPVASKSQASPLPALATAADGMVFYGLSYLGASDATDFVAMAGKVLTEIQAVIDAFNAHTHTAPSGGGLTSVPTPSLIPPVVPVPAASSVAATLARVK